MLKSQKGRIKKIRRVGKFYNIFLEKNIKEIYGIYSKKNIIMTEKQWETIKLDINKKIKNVIIRYKIKPNLYITNKGILVRMGKGKGKIKTKIIKISKNSLCIEIIFKNNMLTKISTNNIINALNKFIKKFTFLSYKSYNINNPKV